MTKTWLLVLVVLGGSGLFPGCAAPSAVANEAEDEPPIATDEAADNAVSVAAEEAGAPDAPEQETTEPVTAEQWLDALEARAATIDTMSARLRYVTIQGLMDDEQTRFGVLTYAAETDKDGRTTERFAIHLTGEKIDEETRDINRWLIFDGDALLDRDHDRMQATLRKLGGNPDESPLPIPLRVRKTEVLGRYDVELVGPADDDPTSTDTVHLRLTPKAQGDDTGEPLDVWFDRETKLPVRGASGGGDGEGDRTVVDLGRVEVNPELPADAFRTALPDGPGWDVQVAD